MGLWWRMIRSIKRKLIGRKTSYVARILTIEREVQTTIEARHKGALEVVYRALDCIIQGLNECDPDLVKGRVDSDLHNIRRFLATRSFNSIRMGMLALKIGYYQQAFALVRMAKEDQIVALDAETHAPTLSALLTGKGKIGRGGLSLSAMAERISPIAKEVWEDSYGFLSAFSVHPRYQSLRSLLRTNSDGQYILQVGSEYDEVLVNGVLEAVLKELMHTIATIIKFTDAAGSDWGLRVYPAFEEVQALMLQIDVWAGDRLSKEC